MADPPIVFSQTLTQPQSWLIIACKHPGAALVFAEDNSKRVLKASKDVKTL